MLLISFVISDEALSQSQNFKPLWPILLEASLVPLLGCVVLGTKHEHVETCSTPRAHGQSSDLGHEGVKSLHCWHWNSDVSHGRIVIG